MSSYQLIVLSGGGAKGPYGLGVLLALNKLHQERQRQITKIYCGSSVGALNATLAAQGELSKLSELYSNLRTVDVLGSKTASISKLKMYFALGRKPFYYFDHKALKAIIDKYVKFDNLDRSHLLICATNYSTGELETFYVSHLVDEFVAEDIRLPREKRRLTNYHRLKSKSELVQALLASTAVPFYFPPVTIGAARYVDGGIGNNTPLRQAAYVCRFLDARGERLEPTFCVINDPMRFKLPFDESTDLFGVIRRTLDIVHNELLTGSQLAWERINSEVQTSLGRENELNSYIGGMQLSDDVRGELTRRVYSVLHPENSAKPRCHLPLYVVRPSTPLVEDLLTFDPDVSRQLKVQGVEDCLQLLEHKAFITPDDWRRWSAEIE